MNLLKLCLVDKLRLNFYITMLETAVFIVFNLEPKVIRFGPLVMPVDT